MRWALLAVLVAAAAIAGREILDATSAGAHPEPAPTPSTTPAPTGPPFPAPTTSRTARLPATIDATGRTDVSTALNAWITAQADGSRLVFPADAVLRLDRGISLTDRHDLVFEGNGATIRMGGNLHLTSVWSDPFILNDGSDIAIRGFTIEGNNPRTGTAIYDPSQEMQSAIGIYGTDRVEIAGCALGHVGGDGVYAANGSTTEWVNGLWVHDNTLTYIGRNAFTMQAVQNALLERNAIDQVGGSVLDIEPDLSSQGVIDLTLRGNTVAVWGLSPLYTQHFVACANNNVGVGAVIRRLTITGNTVTVGAPYSVNTPNAGGLSTWIGKSRTSAVTFTGNTTTKAGAGPVLIFEHVDGLTVTGNTQPLTSGRLTYIADSTNVVSQ